MTRKEFKQHDWKVGEFLYVVRHNEFMGVSIPHKVERISVRDVIDEDVYVNSKTSPYCYTSSCRFIGLSDLFFTRKDALKALEKKQQEFIEKHRDRVRLYLVKMRYDIMREAYKGWSKINGMLRMNIMNQ